MVTLSKMGNHLSCFSPNFTSGKIMISLENKACLINIDAVQMVLQIHDLRCSPPDFTTAAPNTLIISLENKACLRNINGIQMMPKIYDPSCFPPNFTSGKIMISLEKKACLININGAQMMLHVHDLRCLPPNFISVAPNTMIISPENKACVINIDGIQMILHIHDLRCSIPNFISGPIIMSLEKKACLINIDAIQTMLHIHDLSLNHNPIEVPQLQELIDNLLSEELFLIHQASNCNVRCSPPNITRGAPNRLFKLLENKARRINIDAIQMMLHIYDLRYELEFVQLEHAWQDPHVTRLVNTDEGFRLCDGDGRILIDRIISAAQLKYYSITMAVYRLIPSVDATQLNNSPSIYEKIQKRETRVIQDMVNKKQ